MFFDFFHYVSDLESMLTLKKIKKPCFFVFWLYILRLSCKKQKNTQGFFNFSDFKTKKQKSLKENQKKQTWAPDQKFC